MLAFITMGFIFGSTGCLHNNRCEDFFLLESLRALTHRKTHWHSQACPPPTPSTAPPKKLTVQAGKLKYLICCTRNERGDVQSDLLKAQIPLGENSEPCREGKESERGEKAAPSAGTLRNRPNELLCCLLVLWPLICRVSYHQLSFAFEMLIYTSAVLHNLSATLPGGPGVGKIIL